MSKAGAGEARLMGIWEGAMGQEGGQSWGSGSRKTGGHSWGSQGSFEMSLQLT